MSEEKNNTKSKEEITLSYEDKIMLKNTINKKGFFLEEKAYKTLHSRKDLFSYLSKNFIPDKYNKYFNEVVKTDLIFVQGDKNLIIECKKTDFAWIFPKSLVGSNNVNYIYEIENKMSVRSFNENKWKTCYSEPMEIMMNDDETLVPTNNKERKFVQTQSRQEDTIQKAVRQVLYQTKAWRWDKGLQGRPYAFFIPIVLTNANLFFLDYDENQIDESSNLIDYNSLKKVNVLIYNYPEILGWPNAKDEKEIKSIFIVNLHSFNEFLDWMMIQNMPDLNRRATQEKANQ